MKIEQAIKEYLIEIEVRQYSPRTIKGYRNNLNLFLRFCHSVGVENVEEITLATVRQLVKMLTASHRKGTYINGILKGLKSFIQYCYGEGYGAFNTKGNFIWCKEEKPVICCGRKGIPYWIVPVRNRTHCSIRYLIIFSPSELFAAASGYKDSPPLPCVA